jgi:uroporphyrinogen decarboxylase
VIRLGTRRSRLALAQSQTVADSLALVTGRTVDLVTRRVEGDDLSIRLGSSNRPGLFATALRQALVAGQVDLVVHSFKDLPSTPCPGLTVFAVPFRASALDALVTAHGGLADLPVGARVGTSSPRRAASLRRARPDIEVVGLRGNVETRLQRVAEGALDAVVVAVAGLERLGLWDETMQVLPPDLMLPAPAQGALAVEARTDSDLAEALAQLNHQPSRLAVAAERALLGGVGATCTTAVGALAVFDSDTLTLSADLAGHQGVDYARISRSAVVTTQQAAEALGHAVATDLLAEADPVPDRPNDGHTAGRNPGGSSVATRSGPAHSTSENSLPTGPYLRARPENNGPLEPFPGTPRRAGADSPLLRAYAGERTAVRPIWFMRQAGRSLPEYRAARGDTDMLTACLTPELAAELTVQPVRRHGVDAGIFFSDIMVPLRLATLDVAIVPGTGPVVSHPIRHKDEIAALPELDPGALQPIREGVHLAAAALGATPLIGFAGAPFTLASYLVEGRPSRTFEHTFALMADDEAAWHQLLAWVTRTTSAFLVAQIEAGVQAIQLFDSWVGALTLEQYARYAQPHSAEVLAQAAARSSGPRIHFGTRTAGHLVALRDAGATVTGVDAATPLDVANEQLGGQTPLQGNIDPQLLAADWVQLEEHVRQVLDNGQAAPGHVVNLGHGVPPTTAPDVLTRLVDLVHALPDPAGGRA